jgi:probable F420-dependent oxidoreductase
MEGGPVKFTAELTLVPYASPKATSAGRIASLARAVEDAGFDAIGFNDHPVPSRKWLDAGGHEAFDPFVALGFCAAVTTRLRLMPFLVVVPYRNPYQLAKAVASVDILSDGRLIVCAGTGYLRSEFNTLGVDFDERNPLFDAALETLATVWSNEDDSSTYGPKDRVSRPMALQRPHPPIWIGGNSRLARERVARIGTGWAPLYASQVLSQTTRTPAMDSADLLRDAIDDLRGLVVAAGRDPSDVTVQLTAGTELQDAIASADSGPLLEQLEHLESLGVDQVSIHFPVEDSTRAEDTVGRLGADVISQAR